MNSAPPKYEWKDIPWKKVERNVFKLQKRIYQASAQGNQQKVRKLQRLLVSSWSSKVLAVRRVSQDNQGKKTAGIDGVKALSPGKRLELVNRLQIGEKAAPVRRVWIPKPGTDEKRPLGIPTIQDRATQTLVKLALEPEWEARLEPNSYGFRPGRSCWDAIDAIFLSINKSSKWVLDADIAKCFDRISHDALLKKINTSARFRRQIKAWLKAGVMEGESLFPTEEGTPQGGASSPLLANIALHGMEQAVREAYPGVRRNKGKRERVPPALMRYADDLVCLHPDLEVVLGCKKVISEFIASMGLELKPSKTRIVHTLDKGEKGVGFDFLGFTIRQFPVGKYHSGKARDGQLLGFKTIISPSKKSQKRHVEELRRLVRQLRGESQVKLIQNLNPKI